MEESLRRVFSPHSQDPHPDYDRIRLVSPVYRSRTSEVIVVTGFAEVEAALRNDRLVVGLQQPIEETRVSSRPDVAEPTSSRPARPASLRVRPLMQRVLNPDVWRRLRPAIHTAVDGLLECLDDQEQDFMSTVALPLPVIVMGQLLGIAAEDLPWLQSHATAVSLEPDSDRVAQARGRVAYAGLDRYFRDLVARRRVRPLGDLVSALVQAAGVAGIGEDELVANLLILFWAGFETTAYFLGNGLAALLDHAEYRAAMRDKRCSVGQAVQEMLRYDAPVRVVTRVATAPTVIGTEHITVGERLLLALAAANHDPAVHPDAHEFCPTRGRPRHVSFGAGIHSCLGSGLALQESQVLFSSIVQRYRVLERAGKAIRRRSTSLRGFETLPVMARR